MAAGPQSINVGLPLRNSRGSFTAESRVLPPPRPAASAHTASIDIRPELAHGGAAVPLDDRSQSPVQPRGRRDSSGRQAPGPARSVSPQRSKSPVRSVSMQECRRELQAEIQRMKTFGISSSSSFPSQVPANMTWGSNSAAAKARAANNVTVARDVLATVAERSQSRQRSQSLRTRSTSPLRRQQSHAGTFSAPLSLQATRIRSVSPQRSQSHHIQLRSLSRAGSTRTGVVSNSRSNSWQELADGFLTTCKAMTAAAHAATATSLTPAITREVSNALHPSDASRNQECATIAYNAFGVRTGSWAETNQKTPPMAIRTTSLDPQHVAAFGVAPATVTAMTNAAHAAANRTSPLTPPSTFTPPPSVHSTRSIRDGDIGKQSSAFAASNTVVTAAPTIAAPKSAPVALRTASRSNLVSASSDRIAGDKMTISTRPEKSDLVQAGEVATAALSSLANLALASIRSLSKDVSPRNTPKMLDSNPDRARMLANNLAFRPGAPAQRQFTYGGSSLSRNREPMRRGSSPSRQRETPALARSLSPSRNRDPQVQVPGSLQLKPQRLPFGASPQMQRQPSPSQRTTSPSRPVTAEAPGIGAATSSTQRTSSPQRHAPSLPSLTSFASQPVPASLPSMTSFASQPMFVFPPPSRQQGTDPPNPSVALQTLQETTARTVAERGEFGTTPGRTHASSTATLQPPSWNLQHPPPSTRPSMPRASGESRYLEQLRAAISRIEQETSLAPSMTDAKVPRQESTAASSLECDPRIQAMYEATTPNPDHAAGQEEPDWADVVQYWRGVGGTALRSMGVSQEGVRNLGLV